MPYSHVGGRIPQRSPWSFYTLIAAAPVLFIAARVALNVRNIPYADEFEVVLEYLTQIRNSSLTEWLGSLFAVQNEHRLLTSRLFVTVLHGLTGSVNFAFIAIVGNCFLLGLCALLLLKAAAWERRVRLAVILGLVVFQHQQYENFFWGGSSIDHFHVIFLATLSFVALLERSRLAFIGALVVAFLGSLTLAHGFAIWLVGITLLAIDRRHRELAAWSAVFAATFFIFLVGFHINPGHHVERAWNLARLTQYWLTLLGSTPSIGNNLVAPWFGAVLLVGVSLLAWKGALVRERLAAALLVFCLLALTMMAVGRVGLWGGPAAPLFSRYGILSALAWALFLWIAVEEAIRSNRFTWRRFAALTAALVVFNVTANLHFAGWGREFAESRERSAARFQGKRTLDGTTFSLFPSVPRADAILHEAERRNIYRLQPPVRREQFKQVRELKRAEYFLDSVSVSPDFVYVDGWAFVPGRKCRRGHIYTVFRTQERFLTYRAIPIRRPDVAKAFGKDDVLNSGFRVAIPTQELPPGRYQVGLLFKRGNGAEFIMTDNFFESPSRSRGAAGRELAMR